MKKSTSYVQVLPVLFGFFIMGFVDLVGTATYYAKYDFALKNWVSALLPMLVFVWFAILSVPTSLMMNKIGRKKTVVISMIVTIVAMLVPLIGYQFPILLVAFALLGIGNTILQVSLNPLLTNVVSGERLTSSLTFGQFTKAIASFLGPIIASGLATTMGNWKLIFPVYAVITLISTLWLLFTQIHEEPSKEKTSSFGSCFGLLKDPTILLLFFGIICCVGVDVGLNITIPQLLRERCGMTREKAVLGTSLYFAARTLGAFIGAILLVKIARRKFFQISMIIAIPAMFIMMLIGNEWAILAMVFILGFTVANVFSIIFAMALQKLPEKANDISGLMIMGVAGGAIIPIIMGLVSSYVIKGPTGSLLILLFAVGFLLFCAYRVKESSAK